MDLFHLRFYEVGGCHNCTHPLYLSSGNVGSKRVCYFGGQANLFHFIHEYSNDFGGGCEYYTSIGKKKELRSKQLRNVLLT